MADDYKITVTLILDDSGLEGEGQAAGRELGKGVEEGFKPKLDLGQMIGKPGDVVTKWAKDFEQSYTQNVKLSSHIEKQLSDVDVDKTFGQKIEKATREAVQKGHDSARLTPPSAPRQTEEFRAATESIAGRIAPLIGGLDAFVQLMRGAPFARVAETAMRPLIEAARQRPVEAIPGMARAPAPSVVGPTVAIPEGHPARAAVPATGIMAALSGMAARGLVGGAVGSLFGAGAGGAIGGAVGGPWGAGIGIALQKLIEGFAEAGKALEEMGTRGAKTLVQMSDLSKVLGDSPKELLKNQLAAAHAGVDFNKFAVVLERLAITAQQQMPRISREIRDSANVEEEAAIKVRESQRAIEQAHDDRAAAAQHVFKTEVDLAKFDTTRADERAQQARAAQLRVSGAQVALQGARQSLAEARISAEFAPQQAAIEAIQGPATVEGARLGVGGAQLAAAEARARLREVETGVPEDPYQKQRREIAKARHAVEVSDYNVRQKQLDVQKAELAEQEREEREAAGIGPEGRAEQALRQARQAEAQSQLGVEQAKTAETNLGFDQRATSLYAEREELLRQYNQGLRHLLDTLEPRQEIAGQRAQEAQQREPYTNVGKVLDYITGRKTPPPGYDFSQIEPQTLRSAMFAAGNYQVLGETGILAQMSKFLTQTLPSTTTDPQKLYAQQIAAIRDLFPGVRGMQFQGERGPDAMLKFLQYSQADRERFYQQDPALRQRIDTMAGQIAHPEQAQALLSQQKVEEFSEGLGRLGADLKAIPAASTISEFGAAVSGATTAVRGFIAGLASGAVGKQPGGEAKAVETGTGKNAPPPPAQPQPAAPQPAEPAPSSAPPPPPPPPPPVEPQPDQQGANQQAGGLIDGPGSETSDSIPIMASRDEFMIRASAVKRVGVPFLNALNEGRFARGGLIGMQEGGLLKAAEIADVIAAGLDPGLAFDVDGHLTEWAKQELARRKAATGSLKTYLIPGGLVGHPHPGDTLFSVIKRTRELYEKMTPEQFAAVQGRKGLHFAPGNIPVDPRLLRDLPQAEYDKRLTEIYKDNPFSSYSRMMPDGTMLKYGPFDSPHAEPGYPYGRYGIDKWGPIRPGETPIRTVKPGGDLATHIKFPPMWEPPRAKAQLPPGVSIRTVSPEEMERLRTTAGETISKSIRYAPQVLRTTSGEPITIRTASPEEMARLLAGAPLKPPEAPEAEKGADLPSALPPEPAVNVEVPPPPPEPGPSLAGARAGEGGSGAGTIGSRFMEGLLDLLRPPAGTSISGARAGAGEPGDGSGSDEDFARGGLIRLQEGGEIEDWMKPPGEHGGIGREVGFTVGPHVASMALKMIARRLRLPPPAPIVDPASRALYEQSRPGEDPESKLTASNLLMTAFPGLEMLDVIKRDEATGYPLRDWLRERLGIPGEGDDFESRFSAAGDMPATFDARFGDMPATFEERFGFQAGGWVDPTAMERLRGVLRGGFHVRGNSVDDLIQQHALQQAMSAIGYTATSGAHADIPSGALSAMATRGFANGGLVGGFLDSVNLPGMSEGGSIDPALTKGSTGDMHGYSLDVRTDKGTIPVQISADALEAVRTSALGTKLTAISKKNPSWMS